MAAMNEDKNPSKLKRTAKQAEADVKETEDDRINPGPKQHQRVTNKPQKADIRVSGTLTKKRKESGTCNKTVSQTKQKSALHQKPAEELKGFVKRVVRGEAFSLASMLTDACWTSALKEDMQKDYFKNLESKLAADYSSNKVQIFPSQDLIFYAFNLTPLDQVKVVILGQDPYHDDGQAHGLAFSVCEGSSCPPSLRNIFKELEDDIVGFTKPEHGSLESWARQGVLLLNTVLTVEAHRPNSHKAYGWQTFTDEVIRIVSEKCCRVVFLLWGNYAHKKEKLIDETKHTVLKYAHPSPLSFGKFHNCKCFSKTNESLQKSSLNIIDWKL